MQNRAFSIDDILPIIKNVTIFSGISDSQIRVIFENCTITEAKVGEIILMEATPATEIFIILNGKVTIVLGLRGDDPIVLTEFGSGNCIGEASVIGIQDHSASAVVTEDATLLVLSRQVLMQIFDTDKSLFSLLILNIAREIARRLHHTDEILLHYGKKDKSLYPTFDPNLPK